MIKVFYIPQTRSGRVRWCLEEAGAPYELVHIERSDRKTAEHLARHPLGRVPVIEDDHGFVFESAGICLHVADCYPQSGLMPAVASPERARAYQWALFAMTELEPPAVDIYLQKISDAGPDEAIVGPATERYREAAAVLERQLADRPYLLGDTLTVPDILCGDILGWGAFMELNDGLPNIAAYLERIAARPAHQRAHAD